MCRALVGGGHLEQLLVVPRATEQRDAHRESPAEESGGDGDLRQAGERTFFARAGLGAVADQAAFVRVRAGDVGRIEQGVGVFAVHQVDEQFSKRFATGQELVRCLFERGAGGRRLERRFKPRDAGRRELAGMQEFFDRQHLVARLCAAGQIGDPAGLECAGALPRAARNLAS